MPKVIAWRCPDTGDLFLHERDYKNHRAKVRRGKAKRRKREEALALATTKIREVKRLASFEDIASWIEAHGVDLLGYHILKHTFGIWPLTMTTVPKDFAFQDVHFKEMRWQSCSNSHSAPEGKETNWHGKNDLPRGYPGWRGTLYFQTINDLYQYSNRRFSDRIDGARLLEKTGINTGSGGANGPWGRGPNDRGLHGYRYEVTLFGLDFPMMCIEAALKGEIKV